MANYIITLQRENTQLKADIDCAKQEITAFRAHLNSDKFRGTEDDGSRKDWIATADVHERLRRIEGFLS